MYSMICTFIFHCAHSVVIDLGCGRPTANVVVIVVLTGRPMYCEFLVAVALFWTMQWQPFVDIPTVVGRSRESMTQYVLCEIVQYPLVELVIS